MLRLTGWINLVGQHRAPLTGYVLSALYQVHESIMDLHPACAPDVGMPALLQNSLKHKNNQVDRVAVHIQTNLAKVSETAASTPEQRHDDEDLPPPTSPPPASPSATQATPSDPSASNKTVSPQTAKSHPMPVGQNPIYKTYRYQQERTYRACAKAEDASPPESMVLPPCLIHLKADQHHDVLTALGRLPPEHRQDVLDELQARSQGGTVRNVVAYLFGLVKRVFAGEFRLWAGRKTSPPVSQSDAKLPARAAHTGVPPTPQVQPASRETALAHIANIRTMLRAAVSAGEIAARVMKTRGWLPDSA